MMSETGPEWKTDDVPDVLQQPAVLQHRAILQHQGPVISVLSELNIFRSLLLLDLFGWITGHD